MADNRPIGVFDSGIGGLTVSKAISDLLPNESIIYFGDTKHLPYGDKSKETISYYALKICKYLLEQDCKMIVVACNSASAAAYDVLLDFFRGSTDFVNVVDPLVDNVVRQGFSKVGVIATKATIKSNVYESKLKAKHSELKVVSKATPLLAPMIEKGFHSGEVSQAVIKAYLEDQQFTDIDAILLACTHYPLITDEISAFFNQKVQIFDSTIVVAKQVKKILSDKEKEADSKPGVYTFQVSDYTESFEETASIFYGKEINLEEKDIW